MLTLDLALQRNLDILNRAVHRARLPYSDLPALVVSQFSR